MSRTQHITTPAQRAEAFLTRHGLAHPRKPLLVAVSGGPDSVCLLHMLHTLRKPLGLKLHAAHLDHKIREDSAADAQYVLDLCHKLGIPVTVCAIDVQAYRKTYRLTLEEAAREVRYDFLATEAEAIGAGAVLVGHTQDDQVETVLLHIIRGTGTRGLRGLQPVTQRRFGGRQVRIIRPLLEVARQETQAYCARHRLNPCLDSSNLEKGPLRNRVRLDLLPELGKYNPAVKEALLRGARIAADDADLIERAAVRAYARVARRDGQSVVFDRARLFAAHPAMQCAILRRAFDDIRGTLKDIESRHIDDMLDIISGAGGKHIDLPYGLTFASEHDVFRLSEASEAIPFPPLPDTHSLSSGVTDIPGWRVEVASVKPPHRADTDPLVAYLDADAIKGEMAVRARKPGDRFQPLGMVREKKVARFLLDTHVLPAWRDRIPLVCAGDRVLWVVGYRIDDRAKVTEKTTRVLRIKFKKT